MARGLVFALILAGGLLVNPSRLLADGCFVFKWDKNIDINEPTQKAVIVHDAGHEDMLRQVKYEGRLAEFGWLVPVPSLPKVAKGSMEAFYELSRLTQRQFGHSKGVATLGDAVASESRQTVKVIEIKTVGAYEVAVLSAQEAGSLERWLRAHGYSLPDGKSETLNEYIRKGWYFVAARIQLERGTGFKMVSGASPTDSDADVRAQKVVRKKLASGELHPLLISFDTPKCVFPLKISAVGGKPSEISLYVLSVEPLLNKFIFDEACEKLEQRHTRWEQDRPKREQARETSRQNLRAMSLAYQMYSAESANGSAARGAHRRNWSAGDVAALAREGEPPAPREFLEDDFYASPGEMLECLRLGSNQLIQTTKSLPRLKSRSWYLTKVVRIFTPAEMRDLEFQPAIPVLAEMLGRPTGRAAAETLSQFGAGGASALIRACMSRSAAERINAVAGLERVEDRRVAELVPDLLKDQTPQVRLHAARAAGSNWDGKLAEPLRALFRDPYQEIRSEAVGCLSLREGRDRTPAYLALVKDPDPNVKMCSLSVLLRLNRDAILPEPLVEMVRNPNPEVHGAALHILWQLNRDIVPRADLLPLLSSPHPEISTMAWRLIEGTGHVQPSLPEPLASAREQQQKERAITSAEAILLLTNQMATARLIGLKVLGRNGDAKAVELALPLLRDTNSIVRSRAYAVLNSITGQDLPQGNPARWEQWWAANKAEFTSRQVQIGTQGLRSR